MNSIKPVLNTFLVMLISTSVGNRPKYFVTYYEIFTTAVFAILGVGHFSKRESAVGSFTHFTDAFFTMFQYDVVPYALCLMS